MNKTASPRADIYQTVTDSIVAAIEAGAGDWRMPWHVKPGDAAAATHPEAGLRPAEGMQKVSGYPTFRACYGLAAVVSFIKDFLIER